MTILMALLIYPYYWNTRHLIKSTGKSLQDFSHTVMNHSHIETHSVEFLPQLFSLKEGLLHITQTIETLSQDKSLNFICTTAHNVPDTLYGDLKRLNQIILCLSKEAIRFTDQGKISIEITSNDQHIAFTVSDTGKIITPSAIPYLFDIYANPATILSPDFDYRMERGKSSCLSLSTSYKLAQLMGGSLELIQSNEISTQFCLKLPLIPE
jgi:signal transduction histidine kinase